MRLAGSNPQPLSPGGLHRHGRGRGQLACRQGAGWALVLPENIRLHRLPGYSPELNPQEHVWNEIREKEFPNRVFSAMNGVVRTLETGLPRLAADRDRLRSSCAWPWIVSLRWNANWNKPELRSW